MMKNLVDTETIDALKGIGFNKYERNLWVSLLSKGVASAGELAEISGVPRSRCYDVLESLADKGCAIIQPGKPMKYVAVEPKEALEKTKNKRLDDAKQMAEKIEKLKKGSAVKELQKVYDEGLEITKPEEMTGALKGRGNYLQQQETMLKKAEKQINMITTSKGLEELYNEHGSVLEDKSKQGVDVNILAPISKANRKIAKELSDFAEIKNMQKVEHLEEMLGRMLLVDGKHSLVGLTHDEKTHPTQDLAIWSQSEHASKNVLGPMFNLAWKKAKKL